MIVSDGLGRLHCVHVQVLPTVQLVHDPTTVRPFKIEVDFHAIGHNDSCQNIADFDFSANGRVFSFLLLG